MDTHQQRVKPSPNARVRACTAPYEAIVGRLSPFPTTKHLASAACLCPGNNIGANIHRSGNIRHDQMAGADLMQAAWAASRTKHTYLSAQFGQLRGRRGTERAAVAVAHSITE